MHAQVMEWLQQQRQSYPQHFAPGVRVLELGSRDINGSPRLLFAMPSYYLGIDCHGGAGVDAVGVAHELVPLHCTEPVDVVVTTEMLEHDPYWPKTLQAARKALRPGGLFMLSCASPKRSAHHLEDSPVPGYYGGRSPGEIMEILRAEGPWGHLRGECLRRGLDTMVVGVRG